MPPLISKEDYRKDIERLKRFMASKRSVVLRQMTKEMQEAAAEQRFEEAARLRDRIKAIESLSLSGDPQSHVQPEAFFIDPSQGLSQLAELLELDSPPRSLEGIDIAHLQGDETVGSLVCFIDGKPFKPGYRRFRIKTVAGVDDYAAIREVVTRRYRYASEGEELYPDVILIDGGLGQLHAALEAFDQMEVRPPHGDLARQTRGGDLHSSPLRPRSACRATAKPCACSNKCATKPTASPQHYHHILRSRKMFEDDADDA